MFRLFKKSSDCNAKNSVALTTSEKRIIVNSAKSLAKFVELDISLKVFGFTIISYHYPPKTIINDAD